MQIGHMLAVIMCGARWRYSVKFLDVTAGKCGGNDPDTLAEWQSCMSQDSTRLAVDPLFTNSGSKNFIYKRVARLLTMVLILVTLKTSTIYLSRMVMFQI